MRIKPRKGVVLAGIPAAGANVDDELAQEWLQAGLVVRTSSNVVDRRSDPKGAPSHGRPSRRPAGTVEG